MTQGEGRVVAERYRLVTPIGRGGMGVVWRAHDDYLHREVAIKELRLHESAGTSESEPAVRRVLREARAAAQLRHPGIVTVHDVVTDGGLPWIVMELIEGRSLADILDREGALPIEQVAQIGVQVLRALDVAHQRGVLHRDVKPGNIMLDGERVVLTDFGIAVIDGASALTGTGQMPGSPEYIAPERIDGHEATRAADLWAVGVTLYASVTGRSPFKRKDIQSTLAAAASRQPDPDQRIGRLWPVIEGLLRKQPSERMAAPVAIERLESVAAKLTPGGGGPGRGAPAAHDAVTWLDNPATLATDVHPTAPNTRTTAPPPLMPLHPPAALGDVTLDPIPLGPPRKRHGLLLSLGAAFLVAVVVAVVVLIARTPPNDPETPGAQQPTQTKPPPSYQKYTEPLGFEVDVPSTWARTSTNTGEQSAVFWSDKASDPRVGPLRLQVRRDDSTAATSPTQYLTALDVSYKSSSEHREYSTLSLGPVDGAAELEYEFKTMAGGTFFHELTRAYAGRAGRMYVVTLIQFAADEPGVRTAWDQSREIRGRIVASFRVTG